MRASVLLIVAASFLAFVPRAARAQDLDCSPCSYDFGSVKIGQSAFYLFQLVNTGGQDLTISAVSIAGGAFSYSNFPLPAEVGPYSAIEFRVNFTPTADGSTDGVITITSTGANSPTAINVSGTGTGAPSAELQVSPASLSFGNVTVGSSASLQATLTASNAAVTISSDASTSPEFSVLGLSLPVTIPAGQSLPVTIQFKPQSSGADSANVGFVSSAANSPTVEGVTGTGVAQSSHYVYLSWKGAEGAVGYNIFRGNSKNGPYEQINTALDASTNYTDNTVVAGETYYYVATSVNAQGQESAYSSAVKAVVP